MKSSMKAGLAVIPTVALALGAGWVSASSHAEAPAIGDDPTVDNTDVWAWQDSASTICVITAWNPLNIPAGGPNYKRFASGDQAIYEIHIDTNGDAVEDVTYQFAFKNIVQKPATTFLRVESSPFTPLSGPADPQQTFRQTYTCTRLTGPRRNPTATSVQAQDAPVAPPNTGPKFTYGRVGASYSSISKLTAPTAPNDYETKLGQPAVTATAEGGKVFAGPRQDAFFIDLGPTFDKLYVRPIGNSAPAATGPNPSSNGDVGQYGGGFNTLSGKNVMVIAVQIPISTLGASGNSVGVWSSASRKKVRVLQAGGQGEVDSGRWVQVSRLGNPLVNELFIPFDQKDTWNASEPKDDAANFSKYISDPEPAKLLHAIYGISVPPAPRNDLVGILGTDTLKVRIDLGSNFLKPTDPGFFGNTNPNITNAGALLGRTIADDVVDIYLKAAAGILVSGFNVFPNNSLGDGCDFSGSGVNVTSSTPFPYMGTPYDGQEVGIDMIQTPRHNP